MCLCLLASAQVGLSSDDKSEEAAGMFCLHGRYGFLLDKFSGSDKYNRGKEKVYFSTDIGTKNFISHEYTVFVSSFATDLC